ncbi:hypothetical protein [Scytonema sp. NUACC21]
MSQGKHSRLQLKFCDVVNQVTETAKIAQALENCAALLVGVMVSKYNK